MIKVKYTLIIGLLLVLSFSGKSQSNDTFLEYLEKADYYRSINLDTMKLYLDSAKVIASQKDELAMKSKLYYTYGHYYLGVSNLEQSEINFTMAEDYAKLAGDSVLLFKSWMGLGGVHNYKAEYAKALKHFLDGLYYIKYIKKPVQKRLLANVNNNVAMIYNNLENYNRAIDYYNEGYDIAKEMNDTLLLVHISVGLSGAMIKENKYKEAIPLIKQGIEMAKESPYYLPQLANLYYNLGNIYFEYSENRSLDSARAYIEKAASLFQSQHDIFMFVVHKYYLANVYFSEGNYVMAKKILKQYESDLVATGSATILQDVFKMLSEIEFKTGNISLSYKYLKMSYDEMQKLSNSRENEYLYNIVEDYVNEENQFVKEQLERKISLQELQLEAEKLRKRTVMFIAAFAILLAIVLGWSLILVYRRYMAKQMLHSEQILHLETSHQLVELEKKAAETTIAENKRIVEISNKNIMHNAILVQKLLLSFKALKPYVNKEGLRLINTQLLEVNNFSVEENWNTFEENFSKQYPFYRTNFFKEHPGITLSEFRLSCYILMKLTNAEIAVSTLQSPNSLRSAKFRLRQRLGVNDNDELYEKLLDYSNREL